MYSSRRNDSGWILMMIKIIEIEKLWKH